MNLIAVLSAFALLLTAVPADPFLEDFAPGFAIALEDESSAGEKLERWDLEAGALDVASIQPVDAAVFAVELESAGLEPVDVDVNAALVEVVTESTLGDSSVVESEMAIDLTTMEATLGLSLAADSSTAEFSLTIHELNDDEISFTLVEASTGESHFFSSAEGSGAVVLAPVIGIAIGVTILRALLIAGAVIVVGGLIWILASEAISSIRKSPQGYNHYAALIDSGRLFLSNGLSYRQAWERIQANLNTWSTTQSGAKSVCQQASGGRAPIGPEIDRNGSGKYWHYHRSTRTAAHCFYGSARA
ncbi:MAG: hypothetical protein ACXIUP_04245 [Microcella sp.]